jgi:CRISPR-associated protein Csb2
MIAINLRFLAGRFHSTPWGRHVNEGVVEWPPSPWRLLRALIAVARRARPDGVTEKHLRRLVEKLSVAPQFSLPPATTAHTRHYDQANDGVKFFDTFVAVAPREQVVCHWPEVELDTEDRRALAALLAALNTFGRAESWCEAELHDGTDVPEPNCRPLPTGEALSGREPVRVLLPDCTTPDLLKALTIETADMRAQKMLDPPGARWVTYARSGDALTPRRTTLRRQAGKSATVTVARYVLDSTVLPLIKDTLILAEQARIAALSLRGGVVKDAAKRASHSEALTGKTVYGKPLEGHEHAHYLPTDEDGDGRLDHLTIWAPMGFGAKDQEALGELKTVRRREGSPEVWLTLAGLGTAEQFAALVQPPALFRSALRWRSVTPFSLPRFASRGAGKPPRPRDLPEAQLRRELRLRGWPEPVNVTPLRGWYKDPSATRDDLPDVRWLEFHTRRLKGDEGFGLAGFEIEFAKEEKGPLALGFGCHFGLGLFLPVE